MKNKKNIKARNRLYHRRMLPDRIAVKAIVEIADKVLPYGLTTGYMSENYEGSLRSLRREIIRLKQQADEYYEIKKILRKITS